MPSNFQHDLERGRHTEAVIASILNAKEGVSCKPGPNDYTYDLSVDNSKRIHLLEIKDESNYADSPNLCLELYQGYEKRPSGLLTSEATLTIHVFGEVLWVYCTNEMRLLVYHLCKDDPSLVRSFRNGDNYVRGILLAKDKLCHHSWAWQGTLETLVTCPLLGTG